MAITERQFRAAATRLFFDMINADGIIEDNEILLLEGFGKYKPPKDKDGTPVDVPYLTKEANELVRQGGLRKKYHITIDDIQEANRLTTSEAIRILCKWQENDEKQAVKCFPQTPYKAKNVQSDLSVLSRCDGDRDINEAKLLAVVELCLNDSVPEHQRSIPISYRERTLRFARKEILYLESKYDDEINTSIRKNRAYIESLLTVYGYDFVYIPFVIDFFKKKDKADLLKPILMFSKPFYYKDEIRASEFVRDIQNITTADFTTTFSRAAHMEKNLPPCLLVKIKTSTIEILDEEKNLKKTKFTDFIAIPINGNVVDAIKLLPDKILEHTDSITSLVRKTINEKKLYCKGIHKTLIDYVVHRSSVNIVKKVVFNVRGREKYIEFVGIDGGRVMMKPKEVILYLTVLIYSIGDAHGVLRQQDDSEECTRVMNTFLELYKKSAQSVEKLTNSDLYKSLSVHKSNIRKKINNVSNLEDNDKYNVLDVGNYIRVNINPEIVYIRDRDTETLLSDWLQIEKIKI